jgi:hypothetical protein
MHIFNAILSIAMAVTSLSQESSSYEWNKKSTLKAEHQVEFPGIVLEPGVYVVRLKENGEKRSQVQILNQAESQVLATVVAVPDLRVRPEDSSEFVFHEVKGAGPQPVRSWFFSGDLVGLEFVYPESRAKEIAKATEDHVMASNDSKSGPILAVTPNGKAIVIDDGLVAETARRKPQ